MPFHKNIRGNIKLTTKFSFIALSFGAVLLAGCSTTDTAKPIHQMSCTELAREIGKHTQMSERADADSLVGTVDMLISDKKEDQITHGVESVVSDLVGISAEQELKKLNQMFNQRGCY